MVAGDLAEGRRLMDAAASEDPEAGLIAVVALRQLVELLEELHVDRAASWAGRVRGDQGPVWSAGRVVAWRRA